MAELNPLNSELKSPEKTEDSIPATKSRQYLAAISASLGALSAGTALAWTSPVLPQLVGPKSPLPLTPEQGTWVGSILAIGALVSAIPAGMCAEKFGRKKTILLLSIPMLLNWILIVVASSPTLIYIARFFAGITTGAICVTAPMYVGEIAETSIRGTLGSIFQMFMCAGILLTFVVGAFTDYVKLSMVLGLVPIIFAVAIKFMPESPVYLLIQGNRDDAIAAIKWFRGSNYDPKPVIIEIQAEIDAAAGKKASLKDLVASPANSRALVASLGLMLFQQFSGINAVIFYTVPIFKSAGSSLDANIAAILVGVVQLVLAYVATVVIDKAGRKFYLLLSAGLMALCLAGLGCYFQIQETGGNTSSIGWLPLVSLMVFIVGFSLGFGPIPWMMMGELFAAEVRGVASGIAVMFNWFLVFIVTKFFGNMLDAFGSAITFYIFMGFLIVGALFVRLKVPETRGKSLQEIQNELSGDKSDKRVP